MCPIYLLLNHHNDDMEFHQAIIEINLNGTYRQFAMDSSRFEPLTLNESHHVPLCDIDPDIQFHLDTQHMKIEMWLLLRRHTAYTSAVKEDHLNTFSLLRFNTKSLPKHFDDFRDYLELLTHKCTIIGLTETWLKPHDIDLFELKHYSSINIEKSKAGVMSPSTYKKISNLQYEMIQVNLMKNWKCYLLKSIKGKLAPIEMSYWGLCTAYLIHQQQISMIN